jgi:hypothetical protein
MGKASGKRATRKRVADVSATPQEDAEEPQRAATRRLTKLEKDLAAACKTEERRRSRLAAASAEADRIRSEIVELVRHASVPEVGAARKVGHAASAADVAKDADAAEVAAETASPVDSDAPATPVPAKPATPHRKRARPATPPATGPDNG